MVGGKPRILKTLMKADTTFYVLQYLAVAEMMCELACRFTWSSVLLFDDEYRRRQAAAGLYRRSPPVDRPGPTFRNCPYHALNDFLRGARYGQR